MSGIPKFTVLNVHDLEVRRRALSQILRLAGFEVKETATGYGALRLATEHPDLILLDVDLPDLHGFEVCQRLKANARTRSIPVLLISAMFTRAKDKTKGLDSGADSYVVWPMEPDELVATIKALIRSRSPEKGVLAISQDELASQLADVMRLNELSGRLLTSVGLEPVLGEVLAAATGLVNADMGSLLLHDSKQNDLYTAASVGFTREYLNLVGRIPAGGAGCEKDVIDHQCITEDVETDPAFALYHHAARLGGYRAACCTPLLTYSGDFMGIIVAYFREPHRPTERECRLVELYAHQAANAIYNAQLHSRLQQEIAEHRRVEEALAESEAKFRAVAEATACAMFIHQGTKYLYANPTAETMTGYTQEEIQSMNFWDIVHPDFRDLVHERGLRRQQGEPVLSHYELKIVTKTGEEHWVDLTVGGINIQGKPAILGTAYQITRRKQAEAALQKAHDELEKRVEERTAELLLANNKLQVEIAERTWAERMLAESEERYRDLFENANDVVYTHDLAGKFTSLNKAGERITGYTRDEIFNMSIAQIIAPEHRRLVRRWMKRLTSVRVPEILELEIVAKDGRRVVLEISPRLLYQEGELVGVHGIARDISERKRAEDERAQLIREQAARQQAEAANRTKDEFLATVSHELRTPLTAVLGWARMLRSGLLDQATVARALESIERNAEAQAKLIEDLLDLSRIITGKLRLNTRPLELPPIIEAAVDSARPAANAKGIRLQMLLDPFIGPVSADPDRLQQVVWNLLSNAIKFTPPSGSVQVRLEYEPSHACISVTDTGQGVRTEFLPYVFDRFRQADSTHTRRHGGLGLGLAIVSHLVELHGGTVHAESPGEGQGATFTVRLPLTPIRTKTDAEEPARPPAGHAVPLNGLPTLDGLQVLVVDDEADARELLTAVLGQCGAQVITAASVAEALAVLERSRPNVLVSDIAMPGEDGYDLIHKVRALAPERGGQIPAVGVTAHTRAEDRMRIFTAGYQAHLPKPVEPAELVALVASLTGRTGHSV